VQRAIPDVLPVHPEVLLGTQGAIEKNNRDVAEQESIDAGDGESSLATLGDECGNLVARDRVEQRVRHGWNSRRFLRPIR
jgi:hypothetical protein